MLKSRHVFIERGSLSSNDNGRKKFNSSEIRLIDEKKLESPEYYGDSLPLGMEANVEKCLHQSLLDKMNVINHALQTIGKEEKVLIYGGGELAQFFLRHADIGRLNIIGIVDRNRSPVFDIEVQDTTYENIAPADVIIVTPHYAAKNIKTYLKKLKVKGRVICLSDVCNGLILTGHENIWAPDLEFPGEKADAESEKEKLIDALTTVNRFSPYFVSVKEHRPYASHITNQMALKEFEKCVALVIQGPVAYQQDFTYRSLQLYHQNFPDMKIILSVWDDEKVEMYYPDLVKYNVKVVYSKRPSVRGYQNINMQLTTVYAGVAEAKELGCEYVFRTRTDMRFYSPDMLALMYWYMQEFPVRNNALQKSRLVIFPPRYDYFFFIRDFFMFGQVDDMMNYWTIDRSFADEYVGESAETMLGIRYAKYIGCNIDNDLVHVEEYREIMADIFAIVDDKLLDYVWYKYFYNKLWEHEYHYNVMNFSDWLADQNGKQNYASIVNTLVMGVKNDKPKILFYVTDTRMATRYLEAFDWSGQSLRLVRGKIKGGNIFLYSDSLFVREKVVPVTIVQDSDYEWADKIVFLAKDAISRSARKYVKEHWKSKLEVVENPFVTTLKTYSDAENQKYEIWEPFDETLRSGYDIETKEIPFIFEPRLCFVNKCQTDRYFTYSFGRCDLMAGVYFDEAAIAAQKGYAKYNETVDIILYGAVGDLRFLQETSLYLKSIYPSSVITHIQPNCEKQQDLAQVLLEICKNNMKEGKNYLLMPVDVRVLSPYLIKNFVELKKRFGVNRLGVVQPQREAAEMKKTILYGTKSQMLSYAKQMYSPDWCQYILEQCVVQDYEMLNIIDLEKSLYSCADKEEYIGFAEWITYQMK